MKNLKFKEYYKWLQPIIALIVSILILTLSLLTLISYSGFDKTVYISAYNFSQDNSTATNVIDRESAKLLSEGNFENGEYVSLILVSSERSHRTSQTETFSILATCFILCLIILMFLSMIFDGISFADFYQAMLSWVNLVLKCLIFAFSLIITISISIYLSNLPQGLQEYYHIGFGAILLPIFALFNVLNCIFFKIKEGKMSNGGNR